ncbi:mycothione reductase [Leucobacter sp. UCD-THU]|uniref:FAD-dependent oxidoreductase n=1 Tax=Leucobacter sp. UCD-THU TaxID=1292023 RepID=UPI000363F65A|nr:FAD-dependent oxidoreductase [Leucobacter sp. UCD-THU]EYT52130.1 mycothione reductase [Leucobacter sp. UCD-THU]
MSTISVDLAIIGSGSGNSLVTPFWDDKRVAIAEQGVFGGTCLNVGCIPTKMYVRPAALARTPEEAARLGVEMRTESVDWRAIRDRIFSRIDAISEAGERYRAEELDHVELISRRVRLDGPRALVVDGPGRPGGRAASERDASERDAGETGAGETGSDADARDAVARVEAGQLVIAAGSRPVMPDIPGIDLPGVHTSDTVMRIDELPARVVVIGGGYIACEFAAIFSGLGSQVVQVVRGDRLLRRLDDEIAGCFTAEAGRRWDVRLECSVRAIRVDAALAGGASGLVAEVGRSGETGTEAIRADIVLVATGRRPNSDLVGAAQAGLDLHDDGRIAVDEYQRVLSGGEPVEGVYALGDVCSPFQLKHVANHEARVVAHNLEHPNELRRSRHEAVPAAVFSDPELAQVGLTEAEAAESIGVEHVTAKVQRYGDTAYGWAMEDGTGVFKVVADRRDGRILGAHAMGYQASNLIQVVVMAMSFGVDAHTAARGQYWIHPALMEVVENALLGLDVPRGDAL